LKTGAIDLLFVPMRQRPKDILHWSYPGAQIRPKIQALWHIDSQRKIRPHVEARSACAGEIPIVIKTTAQQPHHSDFM
jgi:hypothetical protein